MSISLFQNKKQNHKKITMITCYDYTSARLIAGTSVDCVLVGDSVAMTIHGYQSTVSATLSMMELHTRAVAKGCPKKFIISDLPFLSYRKSLSKNVSAAQTLIQAGAHAIKLESAMGNAKLIKHLVESGVPVMGHIGLTPQMINTLGGYKVQGRTDESSKRLVEEACILQEAGCFATVLECVPQTIATMITQRLSIPTIGIGAGRHTNGQVLVFQDLLGLNLDFKPKFVKHFLNGSTSIQQAIESYVQETEESHFPSEEHCFE